MTGSTDDDSPLLGLMLELPGGGDAIAVGVVVAIKYVKVMPGLGEPVDVESDVAIIDVPDPCGAVY